MNSLKIKTIIQIIISINAKINGMCYLHTNNKHKSVQKYNIWFMFKCINSVYLIVYKICKQYMCVKKKDIKVIKIVIQNN